MFELTRYYGRFMEPLTPAAAKMLVHFGHWITAELHERGAQTAGLGRVDPAWRLWHAPHTIAMMRRELTSHQLACVLARAFFPRERTRSHADAILCLTLAEIARMYGLIGHVTQARA